MSTKNIFNSYFRVITEEVKKDLKLRSLLLLGPRQTGKSQLLQENFRNVLSFDLLQSEVFREFASYPERLAQKVEQEILNTGANVVVVDEIQKAPQIFDEIHRLIEKHKSLRFILTGSSARKLKRGKANLLGGRLWTRFLHPLVSQEFGMHDIARVLQFGSMPAVLTSQDPKRELLEYVGMYLKEEIQDEGLTRSLPKFSRFIDTVAHLNAKQINFTQVGSDAQIKPRTVHDYYQILCDTLLGFSLEPFRKTKTRKAVATEKFYLFDIGVAHALMRKFEVSPGSVEYGETWEHFIFLELRAYIDYKNLHTPLHYWRSQSKFEVDFIYNETHAFEVKAKPSVSDEDLKGLRALKEEKLQKTFTCLSLEKTSRITPDGIEIISFEEFVLRLWASFYD